MEPFLPYRLPTPSSGAELRSACSIEPVAIAIPNGKPLASRVRQDVREAPELASKWASARGRQQLERYIASVFWECHAAQIDDYMPLLCSLEWQGETGAALGLRSARRVPLFCESYLNGPVEEQVQLIFGESCSRFEVMELGHLAGSRPGATALLYLLVTAALHHSGIRYLLFAANRAVRASIRRSRYTPRTIGPADIERLGSSRSSWGRYYEGDPQLMLGDMELTFRQSMAQPKMVLELQRHDVAIQYLAEQIKQLAQ